MNKEKKKAIATTIALLMIGMSLLPFIDLDGVPSETDAAETTKNWPYEQRLSKQSFRVDDNRGYNLSDGYSENELANYVSFSVVSDGQMNNSSYKGYQAIGFTGQDYAVRMNINYPAGVDEWIVGNRYLSYDSWNSTVLGCNPVGTVGSGAIVVQTSLTGDDWDNRPYETSFTTTDFRTKAGYQSSGWDVYRSSGENLSYGGIFVRISYTFETFERIWIEEGHTALWGIIWFWYIDTSHWAQTNYVNHVITTTLYLSLDNPEAVSFNNETIKDTQWSEYGEDGELIRQAQTLNDGDTTMTGYRMWSPDRTLTATVEVNGDILAKDVSVTDGRLYDQPGLHRITTKTVTGSIHTTTLLVASGDSMNEQKVLGRSFIDDESHRVLSGSFDIDYDRMDVTDNLPYPTYVSGHTFWSLPDMPPSISHSFILKNLTTGEVSELEFGQHGSICEPGLYQLTISMGTEGSGDRIIVTMKFNIIDSYPGPTVNSILLDGFDRSHPGDTNIGYHALEFQSAGKGKVTLAFSTYEDCYNYSYQYQIRLVQNTGDGLVYEGRKWVDPIALTERIKEVAESAISIKYFVMSEASTYLTLSQSVIDNLDNRLRTMELDYDIVLFAVGEKEKLHASGLPMIAKKPFAILEDDRIIAGTDDFIPLMIEYDCAKVSVIDRGLHEFVVPDGTGMAGFLEENGCKEGVVTVLEEDPYGNIKETEAIFLCSNTVEYDVISDYHPVVTNGTTKYFGNIIVRAYDPFDDRTVAVVVKDNRTEDREIMSLSDLSKISISSPGEYRIAFVNTIGKEKILEFSITDIPIREGYKFLGENNGKPVWEPVRYSVVFDPNYDGPETRTVDLTYDQQYLIPDMMYERADHIFLGWNTSPDGSGTHLEPVQIIKNLSAQDGSQVVLYAEWKKIIRSTLTYILFEGVEENVVYEAGEAILQYTPVDSLHVFSKWMPSVPEVMPEHDVIVTAVWYDVPQNIKGLLSVIAKSNEVRFSCTSIDEPVYVEGEVDGMGWSMTISPELFDNVDLVDIMVSSTHNPSNMYGIKNAKTYSLNMSLDDVGTHLFKGDVDVSLPYEGEGVPSVWYVDGDQLVAIDSSYYDGIVSFSTDHFSTWVVGVSPDDHDGFDIPIWCIVAGIIGIIVAIGVIRWLI